jgi:hypothetical protein
VRLPLAEIGRTIGGVPYLRPSLVLLFKARGRRPKDDADLASLLPQLPEQERRWLAEAIAKEDPRHPWLIQLNHH